MAAQTKYVGSGGMGFLGWLAILFIGLKLTGFIGWSWPWVLAPVWIPLSVAFAIAAGCLLVLGICWVLDKK